LFVSRIINREQTASEWPRILHQSWKSDAIPVTGSMPSYISTWMGSPCNHALSNWKYQFWTDEDNARFIADHFPEYEATYNNLTSGVERADFARYAYLYHFGGVYADLDFECVHNFDDLLNRPDIASKGAFLSSEPWPQSLLMYGDTNLPCNAIMGSVPGHRFWRHVLDSIQREVAIGTCGFVVSCTGPMRLQTELGLTNSAKPDQVLLSTIALLPSEYFYPEVADYKVTELQQDCRSPQELLKQHKGKLSKMDVDRACQAMRLYQPGKTLWTENTHAVHHWRCTWCHSTRAGDHDTTRHITTLVPQESLQQYGKKFK
jgi:hypothetical protein